LHFLHILFGSPKYGMYGVEEKCMWGFGGRPEEMRPLGRPRHR